MQSDQRYFVDMLYKRLHLNRVIYSSTGSEYRYEG